MSPRLVLVVAALLVVSAIAGGAGIGAATQSTNAPADAADRYVVEQGDFCQPIEPLETDGTVASFYDYRNHETHPDSDENLYSSYGTQHLQKDDTSILVLHEGTDGTSLVVVHDRLEGQTSGGIVSFDVVGVPPEADWVVRDDEYDGETNMVEWYEGEGWLGASWIWADSRTDGGAINGGLEDEFAVTIQPGFNEQSAFHDNDDLHDPTWHGDGRIERWDVLSGDVDDPERTALSLEEPVTVRTGTCGEPSVTYDRTDEGISATIDGFETTDSDGSSNDSSDAVQFESIKLTDVDTAEPIRVETDPGAELPALPDDREPLSKLGFADDRTVSGTVAFSVDTSQFTANDLEADDIVLYGGDADGWTEVPLETHADGDGTLRFEAAVTSVDRLAVALEDPPESGQGETASRHENGTTGADDSQQGVDAAVSDALSVPGIAIVGLAVALLCGVLWLYSSRDE